MIMIWFIALYFSCLVSYQFGLLRLNDFLIGRLNGLYYKVLVVAGNGGSNG